MELHFAVVLFSLIAPCFAQHSRPCGCEKTFKPVCGTDGVTYNNLCSLQCKSTDGAKLAYSGTCCPRNLCPTYRNPICDNYGRTHANECVFQRVQCLMRKTAGRVILKSHDGECLKNERQYEDCEVGCLFSDNTAICDENDVTHESECTFEKMNCRLRNEGQPEVLLLHYGECLHLNESKAMTNQSGPSVHIEGSGLETRNEFLFENSSTAEGGVESIQLTETTTAMHNRNKGDANSPPNHLEISVKARAVPTIFIDDIESVIVSEQATLDLNKDELGSASESKNAGVEASSPLTRIADRYGIFPAGLHPSRDTPNGSLLVDKPVGNKSIPTTLLPKTISVSAVLQPFDMTQPCSAAECDKTKNPVCDSNNRTHKNMCLFKFFACKVHRHDGRIVELAYMGECRAGVNVVEMTCPPCPVLPSDVLICDNLNKTHRSLCELARFNCQQRISNGGERVLLHVGQCHSRTLTFSLKDEECPKNCSSERKPVCDAQGNTHENLCHFQQASCLLRKQRIPAPTLLALKPCSDATHSFPKDNSSISVTLRKSEYSSPLELSPVSNSPFECPPPACTSEGQPVCDTQGILHENMCLFIHARCLAARSGVTLSTQHNENCLKTRCHETCPSNEKPVCANNFVTYQNLCHFNKDRCKDQTLSVLFYGKCQECLETPCPPPPSNATNEHFVCDKDGFTRTVCEFRMLSCIVERSLGVAIDIQYLGRCCEPDPSCDREKSPMVCGTDGRTYANKCLLNLEDCRNLKLQLPGVKVAHVGSCEESNSPVVIDSDDAIGSVKRLTQVATEGTTGKKHPDGESSCSSSCGDTYSPVCGTDDITYTNLCHLTLAQCRKSTTIGLAYEGECCTMNCPNNFSPVCDDQDVTHQNLCFFGKERCIVEKVTGRNISIQKFDVCDESACGKECPMTYRPVCASNGETLINECHLEKLRCFLTKKFFTGLLPKKLYDGECCPDENCAYDFSPVCDSQGVTHANICIFRRAACLQRKRHNATITVEYNGMCCNRQCEVNYVPVCDGNRTYRNLCEFKIAQCEAERRGQVLTLAYAGECCLMPKGKCELTGSVCDSHGQTHKNMCQFLQKKCTTNRTMRKALSIIHTGECCAISVCHKDDAMPVCDNHGGTHATKCHFQNTKCIHDKIHPSNPINLVYNGVCCVNDCDGLPDEPVCDQHGNVYKNRCHFKFKACERRRRISSILLETPCPERRLARSLQRTSS